MSVRVSLHGTADFGALTFDRPLSAFAMIDGPAEQAEQFAQVLEEIAQTLRRMFPPTTDSEAES